MTDSPFEARLRRLLEEEHPAQHDALMTGYGRARNYLIENVYEEIRAIEPNLTDHGPRHIQDVQQNAIKLLPEKEADGLSGLEMYCLGMCILFHDTGNISGRDGHEQRIGGIFDRARGTEASTRREKTLVTRACNAHTGTARDGSRDTLIELSTEEVFAGERIRFREIAAILRFADELAEGPHRTSDYRRQRDQYEPSSRVHHEYASVTHLLVDRPHERIVLAYEIRVDEPPEGRDQSAWLTELMEYIFGRIRKLDQERRYATYYAPLLQPFKATDVSFNFHCGEQVLDVDLPPLRLHDFTVPGAEAKPLDVKYPELSPSTLVPRLIRECQDADAEE